MAGRLPPPPPRPPRRGLPLPTYAICENTGRHGRAFKWGFPQNLAFMFAKFIYAVRLDALFQFRCLLRDDGIIVQSGRILASNLGRTITEEGSL